MSPSVTIKPDQGATESPTPHRTQQRQMILFYRLPYLWNSLPPWNRQMSSIQLAKRFENYYSCLTKFDLTTAVPFLLPMHAQVASLGMHNNVHIFKIECNHRINITLCVHNESGGDGEVKKRRKRESLDRKGKRA